MDGSWVGKTDVFERNEEDKTSPLRCLFFLATCFSNKQKKCSRSDTVSHYSSGQAPAKQQHHQEEEGGGGGAKGSQRRPAVVEEGDLRGNHSDGDVETT